MKHKIKLEKFFEQSGITYDENLITSGNICHEYENYSIEDILHNLPKKFKFTEEQLEKDEVLKDALSQALNEASHDSLVDECYKEQNKMVKRVADEMVDYINKIRDDKVAINAITVDWKNDEVIIDVNKLALSTTREIINGEGMFHYETDKELASVYDGKYNANQAVEHHLHYLLNIKLIDEIYGLTGKPNSDWEVNYWDISEETFRERIEENLTPEQLSLSAQTLLAINASNELKTTKERVVTLEGELGKAIELLSKRELDSFERAIA